MTTEYHRTPEEEAYRRLVQEKQMMLSGAACTVLAEAQQTAYAENLVHNYCLQPEDYDEAIGKMYLAATQLGELDHKLLTKIWRAALAAAASIDPEDYETLVGYRVYLGDLHYYYRTLSSMVEKILQEKKVAELREKATEREPEDLSDIPF